MDLITLLIGLIVLGLVLWLISSVIPIQPPWLKTVIIVLVVVIFLVWLLGGTHLGHIHFDS